MPTVAEVVRRYGPAYLERFGDHDARGAQEGAARHRRPAGPASWGRCSTAAPTAGGRTPIGRSCGDRHCPSCQRDKAEAWLAKQIDRLLPCPYFLVTFTLPAELRDVARRHQRVVYAALFQASSEALRTLAADPKYIGTDRPGFFGVLHTWGRTLEYHPHVHYVVPGGGLSADGDRWLPSRADFLVPVKALSILFRAKFRDLLARRGPAGDRSTRRSGDGTGWCTGSRRATAGESLRYLAPYVFRVAIGDHRIVSCDDGRVTFTLSEGGVEAAAEDDAGRDGVPAAVPAARAAVGVPEGAALRVPEPGGGRGRWSWCGG